MKKIIKGIFIFIAIALTVALVTLGVIYFLLWKFVIQPDMIKFPALKESKEKIACLDDEFRRGFNTNNVICSQDGQQIAWYDHISKRVVKVSHGEVTTFDTNSTTSLENIFNHNYPERTVSFISNPARNKIFFGAKSQKKECVVIANQSGFHQLPYYDQVRSLIFGSLPDQFAYIAKKGNQEFVVWQGREQQKYSEIKDFSLQFSKTGNTIAYVATKVLQTLRTSQKQCVVLGDKEGPNYWGILYLALSPDGTNVSYHVTQSARESFLVHNGLIDSRYRWASELTYSPDSNHFAFISGDSQARCYDATSKAQSGGQYIVEDGDRSNKNYLAIESLKYLPQGKLAYIARENKKIFLIVDGLERKKIASVKYLRSDIFSSENGRSLAQKVTNCDSKIQIVFNECPHPLFDQIIDPVFSPDGKHIAYFGFQRNNPNCYAALYQDGVKVANGAGETLSPDWKSFVRVDEAEGHGFGSSGARISVSDLAGQQKKGGWYDWVSKPKYLNNHTVSYIGLDGDKFWYVTAKF